MLHYVLGSPPPLWGQGARGSKGTKRGVRGSKVSKRGVRGGKREQGDQEGVRGVRGSEGSKMNVMLGFKAPTTSGRKNFDDDI